jgi:hypothetical protein
MDQKSREVLAAADAWLTAMQAVNTADKEHRPADSEQDAYDTAEVDLAVAVMDWREARPA